MGRAVRQRLKGRRRLAIPLLLLAAGMSCRSPADPPISNPDAFFVNGTIQFVGVEGGCWSLRSDEGTRYEPYPLTEEYRVDGLKIRAALKIDRSGGSVCMIGTIVEVLWIRKR